MATRPRLTEEELKAIEEGTYTRPTMTEEEQTAYLEAHGGIAPPMTSVEQAEYDAAHAAAVEAAEAAGTAVVSPGMTPTVAPTTPTGVMPTTPTMPAITPPEITPAPAYEISPEQQEMQEMLGDKITDWVESGGYGLPEDVQAQMIQQQTDSLKAREMENIRVMRNNMERRGITNSGFIIANEQNIRSNTSVAIAGAIADVQIKSAIMKMASFEKAMGAAAQFLGYLSEQSQLKYAPEFATWQAEQLAKMQTWQAQIDLMKMEINQAYQTQNIELTAQLQSQYAEQQHGYNLELAEMELEAANQAAAAQGVGSIFGTILGFLFGK